jgi:hypothetical protein
MVAECGQTTTATPAAPADVPHTPPPHEEEIAVLYIVYDQNTGTYQRTQNMYH